MNISNKRTSYSLSGEYEGFQVSLEITKYETGNRIEASGTISNGTASHYVRYYVNAEGGADISVNGPEYTCQEVSDIMKEIIDGEREETKA